MKIQLHSLFAAAAVASLAFASLHAAERSPDQKFARKAAMGGILEVALGKLAQKNAASPEVKEFGAMMVTDHSKAGEELKAIAAKKMIKLPSKLNAKQQAMVDKLANLKGESFDAAYVKDMVADHKKDLEEFKSAATELTEPDLKTFADQTSAVIERHLEKIESIQAGMKK